MLSVEYRPIVRRAPQASAQAMAGSEGEEEEEEGDGEGEGELDEDLLDGDENDSMRSGMPTLASFLVSQGASCGFLLFCFGFYHIYCIFI